MTYAILHTETRVIRRLTTDEPPQVSQDEISVVVPDGVVFERFTKLDESLKPITPTEEEVTLARVDDEKVSLSQMENHQQVLDAIDLVVKEKTLDSVVSYFIKLKNSY